MQLVNVLMMHFVQPVVPLQCISCHTASVLIPEEMADFKFEIAKVVNKIRRMTFLA